MRELTKRISAKSFFACSERLDMAGKLKWRVRGTVSIAASPIGMGISMPPSVAKTKAREEKRTMMGSIVRMVQLDRSLQYLSYEGWLNSDGILSWVHPISLLLSIICFLVHPLIHSTHLFLLVIFLLSVFRWTDKRSQVRFHVDRSNGDYSLHKNLSYCVFEHILYTSSVHR